MVSGTIPMLVYYGIKIIDPTFIYFLAFLVPIIFSTLTGTSWGSVGTIGVVIIGVASAFEADLGITAGAIIGGAYFGDKMSPLSDTTNLAAIATEVNLYDHIRSMMNTTLPSAIIAAILFTIAGFIYPSQNFSAEAATSKQFLSSIEQIFNFNILLLVPPAIVLYGSIKRKPPIPTLFTSVISAAILALVLQDFSLADIFNSLHKGFNTEMALWVDIVPENVSVLLNRGGLYALNEPIVISLMVYFYWSH